MKVPFNPNPGISLALLCIGAVTGIVLAGLGLLEAKQVLPSHAVARVNHTLISRNSYERVLSILQTDNRSALTDADMIFVLDRLIDEELLVQRGVELGFLELNSTVRNTMVQAVTASVMADNELSTPTTAELEDFFSQNSAFFTHPALLQVEQIYFHIKSDAEHTLQRAARALDALQAGTDFAQVKIEFGDSLTADIPNTLLPPAKLREYVGPSLLEVAAGMSIGEISHPITTGNGVFILRLVNRRDTKTPDFKSIRAQVQHEMLRRSDEKNFRQYIDWLRGQADLAIRETSS